MRNFVWIGICFFLLAATAAVAQKDSRTEGERAHDAKVKASLLKLVKDSPEALGRLLDERIALERERDRWMAIVNRALPEVERAARLRDELAATERALHGTWERCSNLTANLNEEYQQLYQYMRFVEAERNALLESARPSASAPVTRQMPWGEIVQRFTDGLAESTRALADRPAPQFQGPPPPSPPARVQTYCTTRWEGRGRVTTTCW